MVFDRVCSLIEREDLMDVTLDSTRPKVRRDPANIEEITGIVMSWLYSRSKLEAWDMAQGKRVLSGVVNTTEDLTLGDETPFLLGDGHFWERGMWARTQHPIIGEMTMPGRPFKLYRTPWRLHAPAPSLGQHNQDVYCGMLGYSREELGKLRQWGVV